MIASELQAETEALMLRTRVSERRPLGSRYLPNMSAGNLHCLNPLKCVEREINIIRLESSQNDPDNARDGHSDAAVHIGMFFIWGGAGE